MLENIAQIGTLVVDVYLEHLRASGVAADLDRKGVAEDAQRHMAGLLLAAGITHIQPKVSSATATTVLQNLRGSSKRRPRAAQQQPLAPRVNQPAATGGQGRPRSHYSFNMNAVQER